MSNNNLNELLSFRKQIDSLDQSIFYLLESYYNYIPKDKENNYQKTTNIIQDIEFDFYRSIFLPNSLQPIIKELVILLFLVKPENFKNLTKAVRQSFLYSFSCLIFLKLKVVLKIGNYKKAHNIPVLDSIRWKAIKDEKQEQITRAGLPLNLVLQCWDRMHEFSCQIQKNLDKYSDFRLD